MRYIDADALLEAYDKEHVGPPGRARQLIKEAPEAIVRCKHCVHFGADDIPEIGCGFCEIQSTSHYETDFCSYGSLRD